MGWMELRGMWKKNIVNLDEKEVAEARRILEKYQLEVTDIASPLFKVDWPGAPPSRFRENGSFGANFTPKQQDEVLERAMDLAKSFQTDRVRCFDFWRLDDQAPIVLPLTTGCGRLRRRRRKRASSWCWKMNRRVTRPPGLRLPKF